MGVVQQNRRAQGRGLRATCHVLCQTGARKYNYSVINPQGKNHHAPPLPHRRQTAPRLGFSRTEKIIVRRRLFNSPRPRRSSVEQKRAARSRSLIVPGQTSPKPHPQHPSRRSPPQAHRGIDLVGPLHDENRVRSHPQPFAAFAGARPSRVLQQISHWRSRSTGISSQKKKMTFSEGRLPFSKKHVDVITLGQGKGLPPQVGRRGRPYQGPGDDEHRRRAPVARAHGWINYDPYRVRQDRFCTSNAFGGEDRFWLGPEGRVSFSIFFKKGDPFRPRTLGRRRPVIDNRARIRCCRGRIAR